MKAKQGFDVVQGVKKYWREGLLVVGLILVAGIVSIFAPSYKKKTSEISRLTTEKATLTQDLDRAKEEATRWERAASKKVQVRKIREPILMGNGEVAYRDLEESITDESTEERLMQIRREKEELAWRVVAQSDEIERLKKTETVRRGAGIYLGGQHRLNRDFTDRDSWRVTGDGPLLWVLGWSAAVDPGMETWVGLRLDVSRIFIP